MSEDIVWEEPPPRVRKGGKPATWNPVLDALRAHPGEWARIAENASKWFSGSLQQGRVGNARKGEFEATFRCTNDDGTGCAYARYVGVNGEYKEP